MYPFLGMIMLWPMNWAPRGWAFCSGGLLDISQYSALYALLGTTYGGDGIRTFAVPDLRGRIPIGFGSGIGLPEYYLGQMGGDHISNIHVNENNLPVHSHELAETQATISEQSIDFKLKATENTGQHSKPEAGDNLGAPQSSGRDVNLYTSASDKMVDLSSQTTVIPAHSVALQGETSNTGSGESIQVNNMQPFLALNYIICIDDGQFPPRT